MAALKITKKHHKHLNNPFPSIPASLHLLRGSLFFNPQTVPCGQVFNVGKDFQVLWSTSNGGYLSISHQSHPSRPIWSTVPGQAFVSAALAETQVEESRGSFAIKDGNVHLLCNDQTVEGVRLINETDCYLEANGLDFLLRTSGFDQKLYLKDTQFPVLLITGSIFRMKKKKNFQTTEIHERLQLEPEHSTYSRYCVLFDQKTSNQIGFQVKLEKPSFEFRSKVSPTASRRFRGLGRKLHRIRRLRTGWCWSLPRRRGFVTVSSSAEEKEEKVADSVGFNRVCLTYSSEENERFYGFGEQFSHLNFKGKKVPILVQEQGIGRGDQPITFAANLVSYRYVVKWYLFSTKIQLNVSIIETSAMYFQSWG